MTDADNKQAPGVMEEQLLRGPRAHSVTWVIVDDWIGGTVTCHATDGADCRMICPEGCEGWDVVDHQHPLIDQGKCNFVEWMENSDGVIDAHMGGSEPLRDGFIEPEYDDDHYTWRYSAQATDWKEQYLLVIEVGQETCTRIRAIHTSYENNAMGKGKPGLMCTRCSQLWPCETIKALPMGGDGA